MVGAGKTGHTKAICTSIKNIFKNVRCRDGRAKNHSNYIGVGMAVCGQDMLYKDYTSNPIPTSFFIPDMILQAMHAIRLLRIAV